MRNKTSTLQADNGRARETGSRARVVACYTHLGGALLGWLTDEARKRGHGGAEMAAALGVTYGHIHQLKTGHRQVAHISDAFARMCAKYLGVPAVVVKLLAGRIAMTDFLSPETTEEEAIERGFRRMLDDPTARELLPMDPHSLPPEARRPLVLLYADMSGMDLFGARQLPDMLRYLQQAGVVHDENEQRAEEARRFVAEVVEA